MPTHNSAKNRATLGVEQLEAREVPTTFGAKQGLSISVGDVLGTGQDQYITGTGPGTRAHVRVYDQTGIVRYSLFPFGQFAGGVYVVNRDVDRDGQTDLIVATGAGTTGRVKVYSFGGPGIVLIGNFTPFGPNYTGGVQIAARNVTGAAVPGGGPDAEIICGQQTGGSIVKVFAYNPVVPQFYQTRKFRAFEAGFTGGVSVTAGNVDTNATTGSTREIIVGRFTGLPEVRIFDASLPTVTRIGRFFAFNPNDPANQNGVNVASASTDGSPIGAQIFVNLKGTSRIRVTQGFTGAFITEIQPYPNAYARSVSMAFGDPNGDGITDLILVSGTGPFGQYPLVYPGAPGSPAGLNGFFFA